MSIVNLRGTNGSGKSTVAFALIGKNPEEFQLTRTVKAYWSQTLPGAIVVGRYHTQCGGCDGIKTQDEACDAVRHAAQLSSCVFFEGLLVSGIYARYLNLAQELTATGHLYIWAYIDIDPAECLRRVYQRNGGKPIKEDLVFAKHRAVFRTLCKARADGQHTALVPPSRPVPKVKKLLLQQPGDFA